MPEEDLVYLYDSCDLLLHPYKGGAFELNVFEALARGLPVVVTGWGCVLDYCSIHNAYLITPESALKTFPLTVSGHVGYGVQPSVDHTVELLEFVMDNLDYCKKRGERQRGEYVQQSWDKIADLILKGCRQIWETN
jgi:glycosyltransferase involved in cell wall biosynthesis